MSYLRTCDICESASTIVVVTAISIVINAKKTIDMYFRYMFYAVNVKVTLVSIILMIILGVDRRFILKIIFRFTTLTFNDKVLTTMLRTAQIRIHTVEIILTDVAYLLTINGT